ncbi:MAG: Flp pilus assembly protein CpaB [Candidatus Eremiobacteraeota bacterium]|nr:Flp pilus assembly protein CpaB [Candidatus Eremiobacteraeota bacterium]
MNKRTLTLAIAAILALGAGLLTFDYLVSVKKGSAASSPLRPVLIANADIPARTKLTPAMVHVVSRPSDTVDPNAMTSVNSVNGQISFITIPANSTMTSSIVGRPQSLALPVRLRTGMRAMTIPVDMVKSVAGLIEAGDYVDVVAVPPRGPDAQPKAFTIMRDIEVLAVGSQLENAAATPAPMAAGSEGDPRTVTLQVSPRQAELLALADMNSTLRLALRSPQEPARSQRAEALVFDDQQSQTKNVSPPVAPVPPVKAPAPAAGRPSPPQNGKALARRRLSPVIVIDGDQVVGDDPAQIAQRKP